MLSATKQGRLNAPIEWLKNMGSVYLPREKNTTLDDDEEFGKNAYEGAFDEDNEQEGVTIYG